MPDRDPARRGFSGSPDDIAGDVACFAVIGVREPIFDLRAQSIEEGIAPPRRFAAEVMPPVDR